MGKLYVIQATFHAQNCEFRIFWHPAAHAFTFGEPRSIIPASELMISLTEAEAHARNTLGVLGTRVPFTLRAVEVSIMDLRVMAGRAPAEKEWVSA